MDRNSSCRVFLLIVLVALRKESVDRNCDDEHTEWSDLLSLSARRAWIEIGTCFKFECNAPSLSARRAWIEIKAYRFAGGGPGSLSARRAWIEIPGGRCGSGCRQVALRKESVDRNPAGQRVQRNFAGRSPQGERG